MVTKADSYLSRRAIVTIVTNSYLERIVLEWGAPAFVMIDPPIHCLSFEDADIHLDSFNVMVVSSVSYDEPIDNILQTARSLPDVHFHVTGKYHERRPEVVAHAPENVTFLGFLPDDQYYGLMKEIQVVMCLTTENHTLQSGANEALWLGKPIITSDWPLLQKNF